MNAVPVVLFLPRTLGFGGAEITLTRLIHALADDVVAVVAAEPAVPGSREIVLPDATQVVRLPRAARHPVRLTRELRALLRSVQPDIVHTFSPLTGVLARSIVRGSRNFRQVGLIHREPSEWQTFPAPIRYLNRWTFALNDRAYAVSDSVRMSMSRAAQDRTEVLYHGVDFETVRSSAVPRRSARARLRVAGEGRIIGLVGGLRSVKDHVTAVRAAQILRDRDVTAVWVIIGDGPERTNLEQAVARAGLKETVVLAGHRDDASELMPAFDVYVSSSLSEGLSVALLEACCLGLPCVVTDVGAVREITPYRDGLSVVPPNDPNALADAVAAALEMRSRSTRRLSAQFDGAPFDIRTAAEHLAGEYKAVSASRRSLRYRHRHCSAVEPAVDV